MKVHEIWFSIDNTYEEDRVFWTTDAIFYTYDSNRIRLFGFTNTIYCYCTVPTPIEVITLDMVPSI